MRKRLVILGAGESGVGAAILGQKQQYDVFVSDASAIAEKHKKNLIEAGIAFEERTHTIAKITNADVIVKSPGIPDATPLIQTLIKQGTEVISEIEFASRFTKATLIGITGSNGKTTTTSLTYHILKTAGLNVGVAGNIGKSFAYQVATKSYDYYVLELSSFQLDGLKNMKLDISVLLNITPDHLDRYDYKIENYIQSKFQIIKNITKKSTFIYNADDNNIINKIRTATLPKQYYSFTINNLSTPQAYLQDDNILVDINKPLRISNNAISLKGKHNKYNIMASVSVACVLNIAEEKILVAVESFQPIEHRMERVVVINEVEYINDSKATNVDSTFYALESMQNKVIWIAGGVDKGNDYSQLIPLVNSKVNGMVCLGINNQKLHDVFGVAVKQIKNAQSAAEAVQLASDMAQPGETVLLSPACASFDLFKSYEDRGKQFKESVKKLKNIINN